MRSIGHSLSALVISIGTLFLGLCFMTTIQKHSKASRNNKKAIVREAKEVRSPPCEIFTYVYGTLDTTNLTNAAVVCYEKTGQKYILIDDNGKITMIEMKSDEGEMQ